MDENSCFIQVNSFTMNQELDIIRFAEWGTGWFLALYHQSDLLAIENRIAIDNSQITRYNCSE